ncbi:PREDICTED: fibropellin-1-like [Priapulus caudatus]|uniref:Fibropellin-1-like n=1 Tax=Priapulus caudatus TaxID=37621 RepID=A0ABM1EYF4_PRICU|nr:PREDICTED: fibropellin-1-like [Priapulus caudatus]
MCEVNIDDCVGRPCLNNATCVDGLNIYSCSCLPGFVGTNCEVNVDDCAANPCRNAIACHDMVADYQCECAPGWTGKTCESDIDECEPQPCRNNGTCIDHLGAFSCQCAVGFRGEKCGENIDDCFPNPCDNGGLCTDAVNGYVCTCPPEWGGPRCTQVYNACSSRPCLNNGVDIDECASAPCRHGGACLQRSDLALYGTGRPGFVAYSHATAGGYVCECVPGTRGVNCEVNIDECASNPCNYGRCSPPAGWTGSLCDKNYDDCARQPCLNNGTCHDGIDDFECVCMPGWAGKQCGVDIDECASSPCQNSALCTDMINGYTCACTDGFAGVHCEINIDECASSPCQNSGRCIDHIASYTCDCDDTGFNGTHCEFNIDDCASVPCTHGATCSDLVKDYHCACHPGFTGKNCEVGRGSANISIYTHKHHDRCVDEINAFHCECYHGYEGTYCEHDIDECERYAPCRLATACNNLPGDYACDCVALYGGKNCSVELIGCRRHGCLNGGECVPFLIGESQHNYTCTCLHGYHGYHCDVGTTMTLLGAGGVAVATASGDGNYTTSLRFRTTLRQGALLLASGGAESLLLELHQGALQLSYTGALGGGVVVAPTLPRPSLSLVDARWHQVVLVLSSQTVSLTVTHEGLPYAPVTATERLVAPSRALDGVVTYVGGRGEAAFVGCLQDVVVNDAWVIPDDYLNSSPIQLGCPRAQQCDP